jgi:hypothetical protein
MEPHAKAGFVFTTLVTGIAYQDIFMALVLGFFGALGGYIFKVIKDIITKRK